MAEEQDQSQKTEEATPKRLEESRKKGQVPTSREPATAIAFLTLASLGITGAGAYSMDRFGSLMRDFLAGKVTFEATPQGMQQLAIRLFGDLAAIILPIVLPVLLLGALATFLVTGPVFSFEPLRPKAEKISPAKGIKRLLSTRSLSEFIKSLLKLGVISLACWAIIDALLPAAVGAVRTDAADIARLAADGSLRLTALVAFVFFFVAILDVAYQRWEHGKSLRMGKQEVRDEHKETEGDPLIKSRIRQIQTEQARSRMMADVPKADVVITNPTHIAVALSYKLGSQSAPKVLAKGRGMVAETIRAIARKHGIAIRENRELARSLFKTVKVGDEIPAHLYEAVAIILAEIYSLGASAGRASGR